MFALIIRCTVVLIVTWIAHSLIGKRALASLTPYDFAILIIVANIGAAVIETNDVMHAAFAIIFIAFLNLGISRLTLYRPFYRLDFTPAVLIRDGKIIVSELKKHHLNMFMMLSMLRVRGFSRVNDVSWAILEPGGQLSVFPKTSSRTVTTEDLNLTLEEEGFSFPVIIDGQVNVSMLERSGTDERWLATQLQKRGYQSIRDVFFAEVSPQKELFVFPYEHERVHL
ncbi:MAG: DUF421 domain-containing protein [Bacilli bacterium]